MLILMLPQCRWSLPLVREEEDDGCDRGALDAPSLGCSALGAEQEQMDGEEWNDLSRIILPPTRI